MNTLEIRNIRISNNYENECFFIDGIPLHEYMEKWVETSDKGNYLRDFTPLDDLALTWKGSFDNDGDARFMRWLMEKDKLNIPILSCPDDMDFSCIVIVAETEKTDKYVYWKRIGMIDHTNESHKQEKEYGIVFADSYTDEDWEKYADAALMPVDSIEWREWISANWPEELFRRRINYTYHYYQDDRNIKWLCECNWCFDRTAYDRLTASCRPKWCMDKDE